MEAEFFYIQPSHGFKQFTDVPVFWEVVIHHFIGNAVDAAQFNLRQIVLKLHFGQMNAEKHGCIGEGAGTVYLGGFDHGEMSFF